MSSPFFYGCTFSRLMAKIGLLSSVNCQAFFETKEGEQIWCTQVLVLLIFVIFKKDIYVLQKIINFISQIHAHVLNTRVNFW
jgi:hypothetical protein